MTNRLRGKARMKQLATEAEAERVREETRLVTDLGHGPSAIEACVIEQIAARVVRARRLRQQGRDDTEQSRLIAQLLRSIGLKPAAASVPKNVPYDFAAAAGLSEDTP